MMPAVHPSPTETDDRPRRPAHDVGGVIELGASGASALALVWTPFHLLALNAPFGFVVCWFAAFVTIYAVVASQRHGSLEAKDRVATVLISIATVIALLPLALVLWYAVKEGSHALLTGFPSFPFIRHDLSHFGANDPISRAGMYQAIVGTGEQVGLATLATVPVGILTATYLNEIGGRYAAVVRTVADAMTGLPSIIAALFVYSAWVLPRGVSGYSGLAAAMALSVVMLPVVVRTAEEVLRLVSDSLREASLALGAPQWRTIVQVVIPTARTGLVTAVLLGIARAVGETAPTLLTAFGSLKTNLNPLHGAQDDIPFRVYQYAVAPSTKLVEVAWGGALLLIVVVLTLFVLARILSSGGAAPRRGPRIGARPGRP